MAMSQWEIVKHLGEYLQFSQDKKEGKTECKTFEEYLNKRRKIIDNYEYDKFDLFGDF